jgi:hypothetical protein
MRLVLGVPPVQDKDPASMACAHIEDSPHVSSLDHRAPDDVGGCEQRLATMVPHIAEGIEVNGPVLDGRLAVLYPLVPRPPRHHAGGVGALSAYWAVNWGSLQTAVGTEVLA